MERWIAYLQANSNNLIRPNSGYGDWLAPDNTAQDLIGTAFFAYSTDLVRQAATILGKDADAASYASLYAQIKCRLREPLGRARTARSAPAARRATCWR